MASCPHSNVVIVLRDSRPACVARLWRGVGIQIAERVLGTGEKHLEHARIPEQIRVVTQRVIEDAALAVLANPGDGVILVVTEAAAVAATLLLVDRGGINRQQDAQSLARKWRLEPIELVDKLERFAAECPGDRMIGVLDMNDGLFVRFPVGRAGRTKKLAELFPVRRRDTGAVTRDKAPAVRNVVQEPLTQLRCPEHVDLGAHVIVEINRVVLLQTVCLQDRRVTRDGRRERPGLFTHQLHREVGVRNRRMVCGAVENEKLPRPARRSGGLGREGRYDFSTFDQ